MPGWMPDSLRMATHPRPSSLRMSIHPIPLSISFQPVHHLMTSVLRATGATPSLQYGVGPAAGLHKTLESQALSGHVLPLTSRQRCLSWRRDHSQRPSALAALQHPWLQTDLGDRGAGKPIDQAIVQRLQVTRVSRVRLAVEAS